MATKKVRKVKKRKGNSPIKVAVLCLGLIFLIKHSFIFLLAGMLPTIVASLVDQSEGRMQFKTVGCLNLAGMAPFLTELHVQHHASTAVQNVMGDPSTWLIVYSSAALGWLLVWLCPWLVKFSIEFFSDNKVKTIENEQQKLEEEWGSEIKTGSDPQ